MTNPHEAQDGDVATYQDCHDPGCPSNRPGTMHAHLVKVVRADGQVAMTGEHDPPETGTR